VESGQADSARRRHFAFFLELAQRASESLDGPFALEWLDRLDAEHDNLRGALDWSSDAAPADCARLAGALLDFWDIRGHFSEGWTRLERALTSRTIPDEVRLKVLIGAGALVYRLDYRQRSEDILGEAILLARELGNLRGETEALLWLATNRNWQAPDAIEPLAVRALDLARSSGDRPNEGLALLTLGRVAIMRGEYARARNLFLDSAALYETAGCVVGVPLAIQCAGQCAFEQLDFLPARRLLNDALMRHRRLGNVHEAATALRVLGQLALNEGRLNEARAQSAESLAMFHALHDKNCGAQSASVHATVLYAMGDAAAALPHAQSAAEAFRKLGFSHSLASTLQIVGRVHAALGDVEAAQGALFDALREQQRANRDTPLPGLFEAIAGMYPGAPAAPVLLGSAETLRAQWNLPVFPAEREEHERWHDAVRAKHAGDEFDHAVAAGRALTRGQAIESALALLQDVGSKAEGERPAASKRP